MQARGMCWGTKVGVHSDVDGIPYDGITDTILIIHPCDAHLRASFSFVLLLLLLLYMLLLYILLLDKIGLDWIGLDWIGLGWIRWD